MVGQGLASGVVTKEASDVAREIEDQLEQRDVQGLGFLALAGATGVIVAQEVTERVLPILNMPREPQSATQFAVAGLVKIAFALVVGAIAANMSGIALAFLAFHAVGAVVFAGADMVNAVQRSGVLSEAPLSGMSDRRAGGSGNPRAPSQATQPDGGNRATNGAASSGDGGYFA